MSCRYAEGSGWAVAIAMGDVTLPPSACRGGEDAFNGTSVGVFRPSAERTLECATYQVFVARSLAPRAACNP